MRIINRASVAALAVVVVAAFGLSNLANAAATAVPLGAADNFAVLGASTVTNTGSTVVNGDLGLSPGTSVTGFPPGIVNGIMHVSDPTAANAQASLVTAYNNAAGQSPGAPIITDLGGQVLTPGVYNSATSIGLTGTLTLDAQGDSNAIFVFQAGTTLTTASSSQVVLINGAQACNIFWQVGSSATLGTSSILKGTIMAAASITMNTGANVEGRVLARAGAVTMDSNVVTRAVCAVLPTPTPTPTVTPTPSASATPVPTPPLINVTKLPTPLALPSGAGSVTYNYTVTNPGVVAMSNITVTDNKCSPVVYGAGDTNSDGKLDITESWSYSCTMTVSQTTTNVVTATGQANGFTAIDTANATVVVGLASPPPLINIVKQPSAFVVAPGTLVTYTYTVTNPGTVALNNVSVFDNKCSPLSARTGDTNSDNLLDTTETWTYTCQTTLTTTTANIATAEGSANGLTAIDTSLVTVLVTVLVTSPTATPTPSAAPKLPSTGMGDGTRGGDSRGEILWMIVAMIGASATALTINLRRDNQPEA